jgi:hypothetical protein
MAIFGEYIPYFQTNPFTIQKHHGNFLQALQAPGLQITSDHLVAGDLR